MSQQKRDDRTEERIKGALKGLSGCIIQQLPGESEEDWELRKEDASELAESILDSRSAPAVVADRECRLSVVVLGALFTNIFK